MHVRFLTVAERGIFTVTVWDLTTATESSPALWHLWRSWNKTRHVKKTFQLQISWQKQIINIPSKSIEQRHNFLPAELKWWIGVACVGHCLYLPFWEQDFQCSSQTLGLWETFTEHHISTQITSSRYMSWSYLQFAPKPAFKTLNTVHDAWDVFKGQFEVFLKSGKKQIIHYVFKNITL